jgi:hypothetical protein
LGGRTRRRAVRAPGRRARPSLSRLARKRPLTRRSASGDPAAGGHSVNLPRAGDPPPVAACGASPSRSKSARCRDRTRPPPRRRHFRRPRSRGNELRSNGRCRWPHWQGAPGGTGARRRPCRAPNGAASEPSTLATAPEDAAEVPGRGAERGVVLGIGEMDGHGWGCARRRTEFLSIPIQAATQQRVERREWIGLLRLNALGRPGEDCAMDNGQRHVPFTDGMDGPAADVRV